MANFAAVQLASLIASDVTGTLFSLSHLRSSCRPLVNTWGPFLINPNLAFAMGDFANA